MTIRITRNERGERDGRYSWHINVKGLNGQGVFCWVQAGSDRRELCYSQHDFDSWAELLAFDRFHRNPGLNAEQVAHRVAACQVCIGWGPEFYEDRDSITIGRPFLRRVDPTKQEAL